MHSFQGEPSVVVSESRIFPSLFAYTKDYMIYFTFCSSLCDYRALVPDWRCLFRANAHFFSPKTSCRFAIPPTQKCWPCKNSANVTCKNSPCVRNKTR